MTEMASFARASNNNVKTLKNQASEAYRIPGGIANHLNLFSPAITKWEGRFFLLIQKNPKDIFLDTENLLDRLKKRLKSGNF
jgi:hypothetical protein